MLFREATIKDIPQIQRIRNAVKENRLSDPSVVTDRDCEDYITGRGKGWVCETGQELVGFSIADLQEHNIWALFVHPVHESKGIGKGLHRLMMEWYFKQTKEKVWLSTAPGTRAEKFYRQQGWIEAGWHRNKEIRFEMSWYDYMQKPALLQSG